MVFGCLLASCSLPNPSSSLLSPPLSSALDLGTGYCCNTRVALGKTAPPPSLGVLSRRCPIIIPTARGQVPSTSSGFCCQEDTPGSCPRCGSPPPTINRSPCAPFLALASIKVVVPRSHPPLACPAYLPTVPPHHGSVPALHATTTTVIHNIAIRCRTLPPLAAAGPPAPHLIWT